MTSGERARIRGLKRQSGESVELTTVFEGRESTSCGQVSAAARREGAPSSIFPEGTLRRVGARNAAGRLVELPREEGSGSGTQRAVAGELLVVGGYGKRANGFGGRTRAAVGRRSCGGIWLQRELLIGLCAIQRSRRGVNLHGVIRVRRRRPMIVDEGAERRADGLQLQYVAEYPSEPWLAGPTRVAGWQDVVFVCDVLSRRILGWCLSSSRWINRALMALEQAPHGRAVLDGLATTPIVAANGCPTSLPGSNGLIG